MELSLPKKLKTSLLVQIMTLRRLQELSVNMAEKPI